MGSVVEAFVVTLSPWLLLSLFAFAVAVTLVTNWLVAVLWRRSGQEPLPRQGGVAWPSLGTVLAGLIWIVLLFVAGVIAARYLERLVTPWPGYLLFGFVALLLSIGRAVLYRRVQKRDRSAARRDWRELLQPEVLSWLLHAATYLLWATVLYFALALLAGHYVQWLLLLPLYFGALLPDLDSRDSALGRLLPPISRRLEARFGHRGAWHSPAVVALVALFTAFLIPLAGVQAWYLIPVGFVSHLLLDLFYQEGLLLLWPLNRTRYKIAGLLDAPGGLAESYLTLALAAAAGILLLFVDVGQPAPVLVAPLTYDQSLSRYYDLRGRNLVFADVEGTWQATRRRISDRYEILNAEGETYIMLDRYTGRVFSAGRGADDNLYLNDIRVLSGVAVQIQGVEIHLEGQPLLDALPVVYQMEREPGLEHIFISGELSLSSLPNKLNLLGAQPESSQTSLHKVQACEDSQVHEDSQAYEPERYRLHYLTAAEFIAMANVEVETADLVIVATYKTAPSGPTPTPLPAPPEMAP